MVEPIYKTNQRINTGLVAFVPIRYAMVCVGFIIGGLFAGMLVGGLLSTVLGLLPAGAAYFYSLSVRGKPEGYTTNLLRSLVAAKYIKPPVADSLADHDP